MRLLLVALIVALAAAPALAQEAGTCPEFQGSSGGGGGSGGSGW